MDREHRPAVPGGANRAARDGLAALAITLLAVGLIILVISKIV